MMNMLAYIYYTTNLASIAERCAKELLSGKVDPAYSSYFEYGDMYSFMIGYLRAHDHQNGEIIKDAMEEAGMFNYFPFIEGEDKFRDIVSLFLDDPEAKETMISIIKNATLTNPVYSKTLEKVTHYSGNEKLVNDGFITENEKYIVLDMPTEMLKNVRWYHACTVSSLDDMLQSRIIMSGSENAKDYEITIGKEEEDLENAETESERIAEVFRLPWDKIASEVKDTARIYAEQDSVGQEFPFSSLTDVIVKAKMEALIYKICMIRNLNMMDFDIDTDGVGVAVIYKGERV